MKTFICFEGSVFTLKIIQNIGFTIFFSYIFYTQHRQILALKNVIICISYKYFGYLCTLSNIGDRVTEGHTLTSFFVIQS
jgi:hypothetical protein